MKQLTKMQKLAEVRKLARLHFEVFREGKINAETLYKLIQSLQRILIEIKTEKRRRNTNGIFVENF